MITIQNLKDSGKFGDETDAELTRILSASKDYILSLTGLESLPTDNNSVDEAIKVYCLYLFSEQDFPRPGIMEAVNNHILQLLSRVTDFPARTVLTEPPSEAI